MSDKNMLKHAQKLCYAIPLILILIGLSIFPLGLIKLDRQSDAKEKGMAVSGAITEETPLAGVFQPSYAKLTSIGFRFYAPGSDENPGTVRFLLKDQSDTVIFDTTVPIRELKNNEYYHFPIHLKLDSSQPYVYQLNAYDYGDTAPCIYLGSPDIASAEQQALYYNGALLPGNAPVAQYVYRTGASFTEALPYFIVLSVLLLLTIPLWGRFHKRFWSCVCLYVCAVFLILAADESRRPLVLHGDDLRRETGSIDGSTLVISPDSGYSGRLAYTWNYMLEKGAYRLGVEYRTDTADNTLYVRDNGSTPLSHCLDPGYTYQELPLTLSKDSPELLIELYYNGTAALSLQSIELIPQGRFYNDALFGVVLLTLCAAGAFLFSRSRFFAGLSGQSKMIGFFLLLIAGAASLPLLNGYLKWADDLCYHLVRIEGIKDGLLDGQLPVVIYPQALYGNGYLNCMYPNLFLYFPAILRIFGVSMANSYKMLLVVFHILTAFVTYYSVKSLMDAGGRHALTQKDMPVSSGPALSGLAPAASFTAQKAGLLAALLYTLCPYRLTNAYARGALGELLAMTFLPLLLAGLYHVLLGNRRYWWLPVLGLSGLIQTHVLSAVIGFIICLLCGVLCLLTVLREKRLGVILTAALTTLLLNLWFIVPFLYFYKKGGLWPSALDWCTFSEYSLNLSGLAGTINTGDYRTLTLGLPIVFCAFVCLFAVLFEKKRDRLFKYGFCLFALGCASTLMVISQFPGWPLMRIGLFDFLLKNIQFAWRMLGPASVLFVMSGCIFLYRLRAAGPYRRNLFFALAAIALLSCAHYQAEDFAYENYYDTFTVGHESKLRGIPKGDNTIVYPYEWRPYGTMEADLSTEPVFSDSTAVSSVDFVKDGTTNILNYTCFSENQTVSLPLIHYAGYRAYDENDKALELGTDPDNNTIQLALIGDSRTHQIVVKYKGLAIFTIAFLVSLLTLAVCAWIGIKRLAEMQPRRRVHDFNE